VVNKGGARGMRRGRGSIGDKRSRQGQFRQGSQLGRRASGLRIGYNCEVENVMKASSTYGDSP